MIYVYTVASLLKNVIFALLPDASVFLRFELLMEKKSGY